MAPMDGLRIFGQINNPLEPSVLEGPAPTEVAPEVPVEEELPLEPEMADLPEATVSPESARYFGPEGRCKNCVHFMTPASCEIVQGEISPEGVCSLFSPGNDMPEEQLVQINGLTD